MTLATGTSTPTGQIITGDGIYIEGGSDVYFQDAAATLANNPDSDGFYYGLSGTSTYPIYQFECYDDFQLTDDVTMNPITCQNLGEVGSSQRRNHLGISLTLKSLLPFTILAPMLRGGPVTHNVTEETEKFGVGEIVLKNYHVFFSRAYDLSTGDYISVTLPRVQVTEASPLSTPYADVWSIPITLTAYADTSKPRAQRFATWVRLDPSVL